MAAESPLKMIKKAFYFVLEALSILKIFELLSWLSDHVGKWLDKKAKVNFKIYDITNWQKNNYSTRIVQCPEK